MGGTPACVVEYRHGLTEQLLDVVAPAQLEQPVEDALEVLVRLLDPRPAPDEALADVLVLEELDDVRLELTTRV